jgi:hypothetical protein
MVEMAVRLYQEHLENLSAWQHKRCFLISNLLYVLLEHYEPVLGPHPARRFCQCPVRQSDNGEVQTYAADVRSSYDDDVLERRSHDMNVCYGGLMEKQNKIYGLI